VVGPSTGVRWRAWLPIVLLLTVALAQILLARVADLSPWKGGGFGMFATTDGTAFRFVRLFVDAPGRSEELRVAESLEDAALRAQLFPSDHFLSSLGAAAALREQHHGRSVSTVRVEVWKVEFTNRPLRSTEKRLRSFIFHVRPPLVPLRPDATLED
jgi:hypothetical protein